MGRCDHRHSPSRRAAGWRAAREFWEDADCAQEKDWHCATCGIPIQEPKVYHVGMCKFPFFTPVLYCVCTKAIARLGNVFPSVIVMVACNLTALYLDKMLTFRLLPALLLSYGKWTPVIQKQGDEPSLRKKNGKRELIIKIAMLLMGMVCGGWVLLR